MSSFRVQTSTGPIRTDAPALHVDGSLKDASQLAQEGQFVYSPSEEQPNPFGNAAAPVVTASAASNKRKGDAPADTADEASRPKRRRKKAASAELGTERVLALHELRTWLLSSVSHLF
jgi:hypothetical protein